MDFERIARRFPALARQHAIPGAQLAIHHGGGMETLEFGEQERASGRRMTRDAKVPIGSITKMCTATLVMILVSEGDLELDAPISDYLPDLRHARNSPGNRLTLRHLLSHTAGLMSDPDEASGTSRRRQVLALANREPLYPPGAAFSYSNVGYVLAGQLIEAVTGMSWWEAVDSVQFEPLGIAIHFVVAPVDAPRAGLPVVTGHAVNPAVGRVVAVGQSLTISDAPAGAIAASAADLVEFGRLHASVPPRPLLTSAAAREMRTRIPQAEPFGMADGWGLGLALYRNGTRTWLGHDGTADGTSCHLRVEPESGTVVAFTSNGSTGMAMWPDLVAELAEAGLPVASYDGRRRLTRPVPAFPNCAGSYVNGDTEYEISINGSGRIMLSVDGEPFAELTMYDGLLFSMRDVETGQVDQAGRFLTDRRNGPIRWIQIGGRLARRRDHASEVA